MFIVKVDDNDIVFNVFTYYPIIFNINHTYFELKMFFFSISLVNIMLSRQMW